VRALPRPRTNFRHRSYRTLQVSARGKTTPSPNSLPFRGVGPGTFGSFVAHLLAPEPCVSPAILSRYVRAARSGQALVIASALLVAIVCMCLQSAGILTKPGSFVASVPMLGRVLYITFAIPDFEASDRAICHQNPQRTQRAIEPQPSLACLRNPHLLLCEMSASRFGKIMMLPFSLQRRERSVLRSLFPRIRRRDKVFSMELM
jgi:hypothetical protein